MNKLQIFRYEIMEELVLASTPNSTSKDILIVVHNQLHYVKKCIESVIQNTENYHLYIWDNASDDETKTYLVYLYEKGLIHYNRSETNDGFIVPNNRLAAQTTAQFIILLNSDCEVRSGWDLALVNYLDNSPTCAQVGYCGAKLDADGQGRAAAFGDDADFICGWCMCLPRQIYFAYGLFNSDDLEFAYGEDSDLSLRLRDAGWDIYSLHNDLVVHHGNKTIMDVHCQLEGYLKSTFEHNHEYICNRWKSFLPNVTPVKKDKLI